MTEYVLKQLNGKQIPQSQLHGASGIQEYVSGAFGYVEAHLIKLSAVKVRLRNGRLLHLVQVPARGWVRDGGGNTKITGGVDLPPVKSLVFVIFPYGADNPSGAFVFSSFFDIDNEAHAARLVEGNESKIVEVLDGGIKTTYDRETGDFTVEDVDDSKLKIKLDKANKKITIDDWNQNNLTMDSVGVMINGHFKVTR